MLIVEDLNFVPTAAGLASSASDFAALAGRWASNGFHMPAQRLSTCARRGAVAPLVVSLVRME